MVFSSLEFLTLFLPAVILLYYIAPVRLRNGILLAASLFFYAWGEPVYVLLMIASIAVNYCFGRMIGRFGKRRFIIVLTAVYNLAMLGVFKYSDFVVENINAVFRADIPAPEISLPIGISFFTFQAMSYVFDVYRGDAEPQRNPLDFGLYISLFPQLIAGPIVRYSDVAEQINNRKVSFELASDGAKRFIIGMAKKVLIANNAGFLWSQLNAAGDGRLSLASAWLAAFAYAFQIYFDFSGYSDMAIGLGKIFGFNFLENFDHPYVSGSVTEFWRRWHISLSTWFREYVYIPLGGNRKGKARQIRNILIVWLLTGLWHGASWNFVLWGLYYGVLLLVEKFLLGSFLKKAPAAVRHIYTGVIVLFGWVLFAYDDTSALFAALGSMFGANGLVDKNFVYLLATNAVLLIIAAFASTPLGGRLGARYKKVLEGRPVLETVSEIAFFALLFLLSVAYLVSSTYNPFIYFRF